jgi:V/A-type H+-transporting ATPase subunit G/H
MDSKTALENIKDAENRAKDILDKAREKSCAIIDDAKQQAQGIAQGARARAAADAGLLKQKIEEESRKEAAAIMRQAHEDTRSLKEKSLQKIEKAVEFLKEKIG